MRHVAGHRLILVRAGVDGVVDRIAIDLVIPGDRTAHIADVDMFAVGDMTGLVVPVVAVSAWSEGRRATWASRCHRHAGALEPDVLARARRNRHAHFHNVSRVHCRCIFNLFPLVVIAHAEPTKSLASGRCCFETNLAAVREGAHLRIGKTGENQLAHARIHHAARGARAAGRSLNSAIRRTNFTIAVVADFAPVNLHYAVAAERQFAIVVASIRRDAVAVIAFFTCFDHTIATRIRRIRQIVAIAHATGAAHAAAAHAAAGSARRISTTVARIVNAARLAGLDTLVRARTGTGLRRVGNARFRAIVGVAATRLQSKCR